jgi:hypothetical protein
VLLNCGDFDVIENSVATIRTITWLDDAGHRVRRMVLFKYIGTFTNSVTGKSVTDSPDPQVGIEDYVNGGLTVHGLGFHIMLPGQGTTLIDAGTIIFEPDGTVTAHGPHPLLDSLEPLCAALK